MESLRDEIQNELTTAWKEDILDIARPCTYKSFQGKNSSFDPDSKIITRPVAQNFHFDAVFYKKFKQLKDDVPIQKGDQKVVFPTSFMSVSPAVNDKLIDEYDIEHQVMAEATDPAHAAYYLHLRPSLNV